MTIQEIMQRLQKAREQDVVEKAREVLQDVQGEATIYRPTAKWQQILSDLGMGDMENKVACVTYYAVDDSIFAKVKNALKGRYKTVGEVQVDDLGFRRLFVCGDTVNKEPTLLIACNYYEEPREQIKSLYGDSANTNDDVGNSDADDNGNATNDDLELTLDDNTDPFA